MFKIGFVLVISLFVGYLVTGIVNDMTVNTVYNCKVIELQQQQLISGSQNNISTQIRYLIVTDKETFVCESSIINGKFNSSDIFWCLKKDSVYTFKVAGFGKSFITDYRNILDYK